MSNDGSNVGFANCSTELSFYPFKEPCFHKFWTLKVSTQRFRREWKQTRQVALFVIPEESLALFSQKRVFGGIQRYPNVLQTRCQDRNFSLEKSFFRVFWVFCVLRALHRPTLVRVKT